MGTISSSARSIEEDHKDIQDLFAAAKMGRWNEVWRILGTPDHPKKQFLINLIPEDRRWGLLQQAVWWNNSGVVKTLLKFQACSKDLKAKDGNSEKGNNGGNTAEQIADLFGHSQVSVIIKNHISPTDEEEIDTFYNGSRTIQNEEFGLFRLTLAAYKKAFHPTVIEKTKSLPVLLNDIFIHVDTGNNWIVVRDRIAQSLFPACKAASECISKCKTRFDFYKMIVNVYTNESTQLYTYLNTALRSQREIGYKPTANDLALGPYILMFHLLLYCWTSLERDRSTTYRKMKMTAKDLAKYQPGTQFTWLAFVSSSVKQQYAQIFPSCAPSGDLEVYFIIDNTADSQWQPPNIEKYACYTERERVYPAGARFHIRGRSVQNGVPTIKMRLLPGN